MTEFAESFPHGEYVNDTHVRGVTQAFKLVQCPMNVTLADLNLHQNDFFRLRILLCKCFGVDVPVTHSDTVYTLQNKLNKKP